MTLLTKDKKFYRSLIFLALPMMLQNLITFSVGLADNLMVGSLPSSDSAVSGVYMGNQIQTVLQVLITGLESAILLLSSQYWGKGDKKSIKKIISIGSLISLSVGMIFTLVCAIFPRGVISIFTDETAVIELGAEYLSIVCYSYIFFCITQAFIASMRSVESTQIGMTVSLCSLIINVILNYLLIFGKFGFPYMGVRGAATATLISRICETLIIAVYVFVIDKKLKLKPKDFLSFDRSLFKDFVKYGLPLVAGQLVWGSNLAANSIILGRFSESVITAVSVANTVNNLMYVSVNGLAGAVGIIIGKAVGSGDISKIKEYSRTVQILFLCLGLLTSATFALIKNPFISLYDISPDAVLYSKQFISVLCITCIGTCYQCGSLFGLVKSGGDVSFVFRNDTIFVFGVVIPSAIITFLLGCPAFIVFFCLKVDQLLKCIVAFFKIRKYNWMKNLTKNN